MRFLFFFITLRRCSEQAGGLLIRGMSVVLVPLLPKRKWPACCASLGLWVLAAGTSRETVVPRWWWDLVSEKVHGYPSHMCWFCIEGT